MACQNRGLFAVSLVLTVGMAGCPEQSSDTPAAPAAEQHCPKDFPNPCKVLRDEIDQSKNTVEYHVLVPADTKHDAAQKLLESLYRHLVQRRDPEPVGVFAYLYTSEAQFSTPPLSPVASLIKKPENLAPTFDNKIPLEFWQQVEQALKLSSRADRKLKKQLTYAADPATGVVTVKLPLTQLGSDEWAVQPSFSQTMNEFTDIATEIFENIPDAKQLVFVADWKDQDVARVELSRADYQVIQPRQVEERIGALHGRTFLELGSGQTSEAAATKAHERRKNDEYRRMLAPLKGHALISPLLK